MTTEDHQARGDEPHDVLAAEEFVVPAPDPVLHIEPPHDVLAAEEWVVPAPDPRLHHQPVSLPEDPSGITEPHDVLAAEEFAMPAPSPGAVDPAAPAHVRQRRTRRSIWLLVGGIALAAVVTRRR